MGTRIEYEWDIEQYDEYGDIIDHYFFRESRCPSHDIKENECLVLVKSYADPTGSYVQDRTYAYVTKDGKLPEEFEDGTRIPKRVARTFTAARG